ncbi:hypothetical protein PF008_g13814 [Phytophthora fragariae]|uniref:Uncharacterized protein n=1 Tax=Phytophthora fragariae TaxID=53985 RepID=A0A6G0RK80_9STRA|nr:hypothetical protein PF008_g13814 [Phytophthora fragariae]
MIKASTWECYEQGIIPTQNTQHSEGGTPGSLTLQANQVNLPLAVKSRRRKVCGYVRRRSKNSTGVSEPEANGEPVIRRFAAQALKPAPSSELQKKKQPGCQVLSRVKSRRRKELRI